MGEKGCRLNVFFCRTLSCIRKITASTHMPIILSQGREGGYKSISNLKSIIGVKRMLKS